MKRTLENIKSFILLILIILSLFLTGSLWFDNYQGLSLLASSTYNNLLSKFIEEEEQSIVYDKIIVPYKVTIVNPDKKNKWIFYETDSMNENAWNIVKSSLDSLTDETEIITGQVKEWDGLFSRKSIVLEFGGTLEHNILRLAIPNLPKETDAFNNVEKLAITKSLEGSTIYILQRNNGKRYLYKVLLKSENDEIDTLMENCENVKTNVKYVELKDVGTTKFYNNKSVVSQSGVFFPIFNIESRKEVVRLIDTTPHFKLENEYEINKFIVETFNSTDYAKFVTNDESNIFINDDKSSIKFEKNGIVEYVNNAVSVDDTTSAGKNFNAAMDFINNMDIYDKVYLLSATEDSGLYTFRFSVAPDGVLLGFSEPIIDDNMHAVLEVQVKDGTVKYFKGKLLDVNVRSNGTYVSNFTHNIMDNVVKNIDANKTINVSCVELLYVVDSAGSYYPSWFVKYNEEKSSEVNFSLTYSVK